MINQIYQLTKPKFINVKYQEEAIDQENHILIRPNYMAVCHADQRYYQGKRDPKILNKKLPMAMIHESCGTVISDPTGTYEVGQKVVMIPNQSPMQSDEEFYENYMTGTHFLSSGFDGFMREFVSLPKDRVVAYDAIEDTVSKRERIAVIGDGSLAFVVANIINYTLPEAEIVVIGRHWEKLELFSFAKECYITDNIPEELAFDHAFECCGGDGTGPAINDLIRYIRPQGTILMMGVSEYKVNLNTRDALEKGLLLVGSSRSGRIDFENAIQMMKVKKFANRLKNILYLEEPVREIKDIHRVFATDLNTAFKTVFKWEV